MLENLTDKMQLSRTRHDIKGNIRRLKLILEELEELKGIEFSSFEVATTKHFDNPIYEDKSILKKCVTDFEQTLYKLQSDWHSYRKSFDGL